MILEICIMVLILVGIVYLKSYTFQMANIPSKEDKPIQLLSKDAFRLFRFGPRLPNNPEYMSLYNKNTTLLKVSLLTFIAILIIIYALGL